jgi:hypothetical protein
VLSVPQAPRQATSQARNIAKGSKEPRNRAERT